MFTVLSGVSLAVDGPEKGAKCGRTGYQSMVENALPFGDFVTLPDENIRGDSGVNGRCDMNSRLLPDALRLLDFMHTFFS
jgi:hypothetical protein